MVAAVFVVMERRFVCGITHILQTVIHPGNMRIGVAAGGACVKIDERSIFRKILLAEEASPRRVVICPERREESACGTEYFGLLHGDIERFQTAERHSRYRRVMSIKLGILRILFLQ